MPQRHQLASWIDGFTDYTNGIMSPLLHRKWAAIVTIAGALERKVWLRSQGEDIFPNLYVFLTGPPGSGKTRALMQCWYLWRELEGCNVAEISLTKAALIDSLSEGFRNSGAWGELPGFNSLLIAAPELGALLPVYDAAFMNTLTHLYDGHVYTERRRTIKEEFVPIERPNINLIACTTPSFLNSSLPANAWNEGFLSRVCIAYSGEIISKPFNLGDAEDPPIRSRLRTALVHDLKLINQRVGRLAWTAEAIKAAESFNDQGFDLKTDDDVAVLPKPSHPRLLHYTTRRPVHFLKLCMICAADHCAAVIDMPEVMGAIDLMVELEHSMPDIFTAMASGGDHQVMTDCAHWVMTETVRSFREGVPMPLVFEYLATRAPATHAFRIFDAMVRADMIRTVAIPGGHLIKARADKTKYDA